MISSTDHPAIYELGEQFYDPVTPARFPELKLRYRYDDSPITDRLDLSKNCGLFEPLANNIHTPLAMRYHGHQFRVYNPDLGDGRGFLFAQFSLEQHNPFIPSSKQHPTLWDLGTKGSGQTPYSRQGDGRLTLKGAYREALATEMLQALGMFTSKTFCFFETGESLDRNDEPSPTRSAVLTRLSHGHIRIGSFQRLAYLQDAPAIQKLTFYCVKHYYPEILDDPMSDDPKRLAQLFLDNVCQRLARLSAQYMMAGFVHGVLNSDNINITGESFDYGPYRFLPHYDPQFTAAYFDQQGLYCYGRQPTAIFWDLQQLAQCLDWGFAGLDTAKILSQFNAHFSHYILHFFCHRLNIRYSENNKTELNQTLAMFFQFLSSRKIPFEQAFFDLAVGRGTAHLEKSIAHEFYQDSQAQTLIQHLQNQSTDNADFFNHAYFNNEQACSMLIDEIETMWKPISENDDWSLFDKKIDAIRKMRGLYQLTT